MIFINFGRDYPILAGRRDDQCTWRLRTAAVDNINSTVKCKGWGKYRTQGLENSVSFGRLKFENVVLEPSGASGCAAPLTDPAGLLCSKDLHLGLD